MHPGISVFRQLLQLVPWTRFDDVVKQHRADAGVRTLTTRDQLISLLFGQSIGASGLREIITAMTSHQAQLAHLGVGRVARSTLADANALRPVAPFTALLDDLLAQAQPGLRRKIRDIVHLIDATSLRLSGLGSRWARVSAHRCGVKLHLVYDPDADRPVYHQVTSGKVNDITPAKQMPIDPRATYVFDLGYYDYGWWNRLHQLGCRFVTRLKSNTPLRVVAETPVPKGTTLLSDRIGHLPQRQAQSRKTPFQDPVREIRVRIESGTVLRILTNDLDAPAEEIAGLYKRRWLIELFFRWIKQVLRIKRLVGHSENAVRIHLAVALITFVLLRLAQAAHKLVNSPLIFARLVRLNLMHERPISSLLEPDKPPPKCPQQLCFDLRFP